MTTNINANLLTETIKRIENLNAQVEVHKEDIKDLFAGAKDAGLDPKIMREIIKINKRGTGAVTEEQFLIDCYLKAMGKLPLFEAANQQDEVAK